MKKATLISISLIALGFVFEYLYYMVDSTFFDIKFSLLGILCILFGCIHLWLYTVAPYLDKNTND